MPCHQFVLSALYAFGTEPVFCRFRSRSLVRRLLKHPLLVLVAGSVSAPASAAASPGSTGRRGKEACRVGKKRLSARDRTFRFAPPHFLEEARLT